MDLANNPFSNVQFISRYFTSPLTIFFFFCTGTVVAVLYLIVELIAVATSLALFSTGSEILLLKIKSKIIVKSNSWALCRYSLVCYTHPHAVDIHIIHIQPYLLIPVTNGCYTSHLCFDTGIGRFWINIWNMNKFLEYF